MLLAGLCACSSVKSVLRTPSTRRGPHSPHAMSSGERTSLVFQAESVAAPSVNGQSSIAWAKTFGPAGPVRLDRVAFNDSWISYVTPAETSAIAGRLDHDATRRPNGNRTLVWSDGRIQSITAILGQSPDGRAVAIANGGSWQLIDTESQRTFDLNAFGVDQRRVLGDQDARGLAFHPSLPVLALLVQTDGHAGVTFLNFDDGSTRSALPLSSEVFHVAWDAGGEYLVLDELSADSNGNQRLDWPVPELIESSANAPALQGRYIAAAPRGDRAVTSILSQRDAMAVAVPGAIMQDADGWLVLQPDRQIAYAANGVVRRLTPTDCDAKLVASHASTKRVLVGCYEKSRLRLGLASRQGFVALDVDMPAAEDFPRRPLRQRFLAIYAGTRSYLVDFERSSVVSLAERDQLLAQKGTSIILRRGPNLIRRDALSGDEVVVAEGIASGKRVIMRDEYVWVDPYVVGADPKFVSYRAPNTVAAIGRSGCALCYSEPSDAPRHPRGPFHWFCGNPSAEESALISADTDPKRASGSIANAWSTHSSTSEESSGRNAVRRGLGAAVAAR